MTYYVIEYKPLYNCEDDYYSFSIPVGIKELKNWSSYLDKYIKDNDTGCVYEQIYRCKREANKELRKKQKEFLEISNWEEAIPYIEEIINANRKRNQNTGVH